LASLSCPSSFFSKISNLLEVPPSSSGGTASNAVAPSRESLRRRSTMGAMGGAGALYDLTGEDGAGGDDDEGEEGRKVMALLRSSEGFDPVEDEKRILLERFAKAAIRGAADADKGTSKAPPRVPALREEESATENAATEANDTDDEEEDTGTQLVRPRFASDGSSRHLQIVMILANNPACPVLARTRNGVNAAFLMAACPSSDAMAVLTWLLEAASKVTPSSENGKTASDQSIWEPDAAGANICHYAAYSASADCLRLLSRLPSNVCPEGLLAKMIASKDRFGRTPLDVLSIYSEESILSSTRTQALKKVGLWNEVPFESRRREFRALATSLL
jgi:hypothetical protein